MKFLTHNNFLNKWFFSTNHKQIGILYFIFGVFSSVLGATYSFFIRTELTTPGSQWLHGNYHFYNTLITSHGLVMIFFAAMPILMGGYGNWFIPILIGAPDMAYPRLNNLSFWLLPASLLLFILSSWTEGGVAAGWTLYSPLSSIIESPTAAMDFLIYSLHLASISSILGSMNFIVTIGFMRSGGLTMRCIPLFCWSVLLTAILLCLALPVLAAAVTMLLTDRKISISFFMWMNGGDPVFFQHMFWFFGYPEVYILILPTFGLIDYVLTKETDRPIFGYAGMVQAMGNIPLLGFLVWVHHVFTIKLDTNTRVYFNSSTLIIIAIPIAVKIFVWMASYLCNRLSSVSMLFTWAFVIFVSIGTFFGVVFISACIDVYFHDTYFIINSLHNVLSMGVVFGIFAGFYYWFPKATGFSLNELLSKLHFWTFFIGVNLTFFPMFYLGFLGLPGRITDYSDIFTYWNYWSTVGSTMTIWSYILFFYILFSAWLNKSSNFFLSTSIKHVKNTFKKISIKTFFKEKYFLLNKKLTESKALSFDKATEETDTCYILCGFSFWDGSKQYYVVPSHIKPNTVYPDTVATWEMQAEWVKVPGTRKEGIYDTVYVYVDPNGNRYYFRKLLVATEFARLPIVNPSESNLLVPGYKSFFLVKKKWFFWSEYHVYLYINSYRLFGIVFNSGEGNFATTIFCEHESEPIKIYDHSIYFHNFNNSIVRDTKGNIYFKLRPMSKKTFNIKREWLKKEIMNTKLIVVSAVVTATILSFGSLIYVL